MTKKSIVLAAMTAFMIGLVAYALSAQQFGRDFDREFNPGPDHGRRFGRIAEYLDLEVDQADQWFQIIDEQHARRNLRRDQIMDLRARFKEVADQESPELEVLGQIALDIYNEVEASRVERKQIRSELDAILTPEQRERFEALEAAREFSGRSHHGKDGRGFRPDETDS